MDGTPFSLNGLPVNRFINLGRQYRDNSIVHTVYIRKLTLGCGCTIQPRKQISGYCYYSLIECENAGIVGVVFYTYINKTRVTHFALTVERNVQLEKVQEESFTPMFILEKSDLLVYSSDCGSVVVISTLVVDTPLLVQVT